MTPAKGPARVSTDPIRAPATATPLAENSSASPPLSDPAAAPSAKPTMAELLDAAGPAFAQLQRGDVVEGTLVGRAGDSLIVDVRAKAEGIVAPSEMHSLTPEQRGALSVGDTLLVYVLQPEVEEDQLMLSIDRARGEQGWRELQNRHESGVIFEAGVTGFNKGGLLVNVEGVNAFVPLSQVVGAAPDRESGGGLADFVGRTLRLKVIEINRRRNRVILSERAAMQEWRAEQKDRLLSELREGEIRSGKVTSIRSFGVFVDLGGADGLVHLSELSWDREVNPESLFKIGEPVDVYVMKVDHEAKKIGLSIRRARPEQWDIVVGNYEVNQVVPGIVTKLVTFGAFARIEGPVEGLIHVLRTRRSAHLAPPRGPLRGRCRADQDRPHRARPPSPGLEPAPGPWRGRAHRLGLQRRGRHSDAARGGRRSVRRRARGSPAAPARRRRARRGRPRDAARPPLPRPPPSAPWKRRCSGPASPRKTSVTGRPRHSRAVPRARSRVAGIGRAIRYSGPAVP